LVPSEHSSGGKQRLGSITKQGNHLMRTLVEAAQTTARLEPEFEREYLHLAHSKSKAVAKVAAARKHRRAVVLDAAHRYGEPAIVSIESRPRVPLVGAS
jgi:transposase